MIVNVKCLFAVEVAAEMERRGWKVDRNPGGEVVQ